MRLHALNVDQIRQIRMVGTNQRSPPIRPVTRLAPANVMQRLALSSPMSRMTHDRLWRLAKRCTVLHCSRKLNTHTKTLRASSECGHVEQRLPQLRLVGEFHR